MHLWGDLELGAGPNGLQRREQLLRKVMESAAVGMALLDGGRRIVFANGAFAQMLGRSVAALRGLPVADLVHADCDAAAVHHLGRLLKGETGEHRGEWRLRHDDGSPLWTLASASLLDGDSAPGSARIILQVVSIDRQKRAEAALAYAESRWSFALDAAGQGVWDYDGRTGDIFYSDTWRAMRGIPKGEHVDPSQAEWLKRVHPDDVARLLASVGRQNTGEKGYDTLEYRERHRDGHWIWVLSRGRPVEWDEAGNPLRTIGTDTDITCLKRVEEQLAHEKERLRVTLESIADGVISTDTATRVTFMNQVAEELTGWSLAEAKGQPLNRVFDLVEEGTRAPATPDLIRGMAEDRKTFLADVQLVSRGDERRDVRSAAAPLHAADGSVVGAVLVFQDVSESRALQRQLAHSATHDPLTGLPNRYAFERALRSLGGNAAGEERGHVLCYIDLDRFKAVNDGSGHAAGDALLRQVAEVIRAGCRKDDLAARLGGDEFALLMPGCALPAARRAAQRIVDSIAAIRFSWDGRTYSIGASMGLAPMLAGSPPPEQIIARADAACYAAKANGRGRVEVYAG